MTGSVCEVFLSRIFKSSPNPSRVFAMMKHYKKMPVKSQVNFKKNYSLEYLPINGQNLVLGKETKKDQK